MRASFYVLTTLAGVLSCFFVEAADIPDLRYRKAYTAPNCAGASYEFFDYTPELSVYGMDNSIMSIYFTGNWILYADNFYNFEVLGGTYVHRSGINVCYNLVSPLAGN
ncbi:uncharacterized protein LOC125177593, partial [Hyalella azteca]|uniref:Uncharacterized protein LOC125177593 n=1 Tax=Hyalella azteca TaxID=294128 RepID=A0A979FF64_HYAAZ